MIYFLFLNEETKLLARLNDRLLTHFRVIRRLPYRRELEMGVDMITRQRFQHQFLVEEIIVRSIACYCTEKAGKQHS